MRRIATRWNRPVSWMLAWVFWLGQAAPAAALEGYFQQGAARATRGAGEVMSEIAQGWRERLPQLEAAALVGAARLRTAPVTTTFSISLARLMPPESQDALRPKLGEAMAKLLDAGAISGFRIEPQAERIAFEITSSGALSPVDWRRIIDGLSAAVSAHTGESVARPDLPLDGTQGKTFVATRPGVVISNDLRAGIDQEGGSKIAVAFELGRALRIGGNVQELTSQTGDLDLQARSHAAFELLRRAARSAHAKRVNGDARQVRQAEAIREGGWLRTVRPIGTRVVLSYLDDDPAILRDADGAWALIGLSGRFRGIAPVPEGPEGSHYFKLALVEWAVRAYGSEDAALPFLSALITKEAEQLYLPTAWVQEQYAGLELPDPVILESYIEPTSEDLALLNEGFQRIDGAYRAAKERAAERAERLDPARNEGLRLSKALEAEYGPELFGEKTVVGDDGEARRINVEDTLEAFTEDLAGEMAQAKMASVRELDALARGETGLKPNLEREYRDVDGHVMTHRRMFLGLVDNLFGRKTKDRWRLNEETPIPEELHPLKRPGLEGTGPWANLGMAFRALNAKTASWMPDAEDAKPRDAKSGDLLGPYEMVRNIKHILSGEWDDKEFVHPDTGKRYKIETLRKEWATIFLRVPGLHLREDHVYYNGRRVPGMLVFFLLHALNNYHEDRHIQFYVPKIDTHAEALVVGKTLDRLEKTMGLARGTIKIKILNERGMFVMNQIPIMHTLRHWLIGTNVGRWDYLNSIIELLWHKSKQVVSDPHRITMLYPNMVPYPRRNTFLMLMASLNDALLPEHGAAIGGMFAKMKLTIYPSDSPEEQARKRRINQRALRGAWQDKLQERLAGLFEIVDPDTGDRRRYDVLRQSWVATPDAEYVLAGEYPLKGTLEEVERLINDGVEVSYTDPDDGRTYTIWLGRPRTEREGDLSDEEREEWAEYDRMIAAFEAQGLLRLEGGRYVPSHYVVSAEDLTPEAFFSEERIQELFGFPDRPVVTEEGIMRGIRMASEYLFQLMQGNFAAALEDLDGTRFMNDLATYEIFWHWLWTLAQRGDVQLTDEQGNPTGEFVTQDYLREMLRRRWADVVEYYEGEFQRNYGARGFAPLADADVEARWQHVLGFFESLRADGVSTRFDINYAPLTMRMLERQLFNPAYVQYGSRLIMEASEVSDEEREAVFDAVLGREPGAAPDRGELVARVKAASVKAAAGNDAELRLAVKALEAHDYVYNIYAEGLSQPVTQERLAFNKLNEIGLSVEAMAEEAETVDQLVALVGEDDEQGREIRPTRMISLLDRARHHLEDVRDWFRQPRFARLERMRSRRWQASDVVTVQGIERLLAEHGITEQHPLHNLLAQKLYNAKKFAQQSRDFIATGGAMDGQSAARLAEAGHVAYYFSGWQASHHWGKPDLAKYPFDQAAKKIAEINKYLANQHRNQRVLFLDMWNELEALFDEMYVDIANTPSARERARKQEAWTARFRAAAVEHDQHGKKARMFLDAVREDPDTFIGGLFDEIVSQAFTELPATGVAADRTLKRQAYKAAAYAGLQAFMVDYLIPGFVDGDTGHESLSEMVRLFVEAGAGAIHLEDQAHGLKKCGHMAGKVLVSVKKHVERLLEARYAADKLGSKLMIVARTDAQAAKLLESNEDPRDHFFIRGATNRAVPSLARVIRYSLREVDAYGGTPESLVNDLQANGYGDMAQTIRAIWAARGEGVGGALLGHTDLVYFTESRPGLMREGQRAGDVGQLWDREMQVRIRSGEIPTLRLDTLLRVGDPVDGELLTVEQIIARQPKRPEEVVELSHRLTDQWATHAQLITFAQAVREAIGAAASPYQGEAMDPEDPKFVYGNPLGTLVARTEDGGADVPAWLAADLPSYQAAGLKGVYRGPLVVNGRALNGVAYVDMSDEELDAVAARWAALTDPLYGPQVPSAGYMKRLAASEFGIEFHWDMDQARTYEGYYQLDSASKYRDPASGIEVKLGVINAAVRLREFAGVADTGWMEQGTPDVPEAEALLYFVKSDPKGRGRDLFFSINLSPSFDWSNPRNWRSVLTIRTPQPEWRDPAHWPGGLTEEQQRLVQEALGDPEFDWNDSSTWGDQEHFRAVTIVHEHFAEEKIRLIEDAISAPGFDWRDPDSWGDERRRRAVQDMVEHIMDFSFKMGQAGYVFQFVTIFQDHVSTLAIYQAAKQLLASGAGGFVRSTQQIEWMVGNRFWKHQTTAGVPLTDKMLVQVAGGRHTGVAAAGGAATEGAFGVKTRRAPAGSAAGVLQVLGERQHNLSRDPNGYSQLETVPDAMTVGEALGRLSFNFVQELNGVGIPRAGFVPYVHRRGTPPDDFTPARWSVTLQPGDQIRLALRPEAPTLEEIAASLDRAVDTIRPDITTLKEWGLIAQEGSGASATFNLTARTIEAYTPLFAYLDTLPASVSRRPEARHAHGAHVRELLSVTDTDLRRAVQQTGGALSNEIWITRRPRQDAIKVSVPYSNRINVFAPEGVSGADILAAILEHLRTKDIPLDDQESQGPAWVAMREALERFAAQALHEREAVRSGEDRRGGGTDDPAAQHLEETTLDLAPPSERSEHRGEMNTTYVSVALAAEGFRGRGKEWKTSGDDRAKEVSDAVTASQGVEATYMAYEGALDEEIGELEADQYHVVGEVVNPGGAIKDTVIEDPVEGTNAMATDNNGVPRAALSPSESGATSIRVSGDGVKALGGIPDIYADLIVTRVPPARRAEVQAALDPEVDPENPYPHMRATLELVAEANGITMNDLEVVIMNRERERVRLAALERLQQEFPDLVVTQISDGTVAPGVEAAIGRKAGKHLVEWTVGKTAEGFYNLTLTKAVQRRGAVAAARIYSTQVNGDTSLAARYQFLPHQVNAIRRARPHDAEDILAGRLILTPDDVAGPVNGSMSMLTDNGWFNLPGVEQLEDGRYRVVTLRFADPAGDGSGAAWLDVDDIDYADVEAVVGAGTEQLKRLNTPSVLETSPYLDRLAALGVEVPDGRTALALQEGVWAPAFEEALTYTISPEVAQRAVNLAEPLAIVLHSSLFDEGPDAAATLRRIQEQLLAALEDVDGLDGDYALRFVLVMEEAADADVAVKARALALSVAEASDRTVSLSEEQFALPPLPDVAPEELVRRIRQGILNGAIGAVIGPRAWAQGVKTAAGSDAVAVVAFDRADDEETVRSAGAAIAAGVEAAVAGGRLSPEVAVGFLVEQTPDAIVPELIDLERITEELAVYRQRMKSTRKAIERA
ncbi:MAG TPA: isocitrate lyase/phosphoenolpyruvate mutase family protein [bacterium]